MDLKDLMNPEFQVKQARYENARHAVDAAWSIAVKSVDTYTPSTKVVEGGKIEWVGDDKKAPEAYVAELAIMAELLAKEIQKDLDSTLTVLDEKKEAKNGNTKGTPSTLPRLN
jgi:hypothetical protein